MCLNVCSADALLIKVVFTVLFCFTLQVSVYAPAHLIDQTQFALDVATKVLEFYEEFYGLKYPLKKSGWYCGWFENCQYRMHKVSIEC